MRPPSSIQRSNSSKKDGRPKPDDYAYDIPCTWDDLEEDDNGYGNEKALWPKTNDDIDQRFSLGLISKDQSLETVSLKPKKTNIMPSLVSCQTSNSRHQAFLEDG
jgi:hypothetical protein